MLLLRLREALSFPKIFQTVRELADMTVAAALLWLRGGWALEAGFAPGLTPERLHKHVCRDVGAIIGAYQALTARIMPGMPMMVMARLRL